MVYCVRKEMNQTQKGLHAPEQVLSEGNSFLLLLSSSLFLFANSF